MKLKLKENPREWQKFGVVMAVLLGTISLVLRLQHRIGQSTLILALCGLSFGLLLCLMRPAWFRSFYRVGMTVSYYVGQGMGKVLLAMVFLLVVTPLGLALRLAGKDLLNLKRKTGVMTYWRPAKPAASLEQQF